MTKLQERRKAAGLSQSKLAERAGLSVRTLQHYEQGTMDVNSAAAMTVYQLAQALCCQMEDLLEHDGGNREK